MKTGIIVLMIFLRYLADIIDGKVARKYKKTSKLGGYLDTISDVMFSGAITYVLFNGKEG